MHIFKVICINCGESCCSPCEQWALNRSLGPAVSVLVRASITLAFGKKGRMKTDGWRAPLPAVDADTFASGSVTQVQLTDATARATPLSQCHRPDSAANSSSFQWYDVLLFGRLFFLFWIHGGVTAFSKELLIMWHKPIVYLCQFRSLVMASVWKVSPYEWSRDSTKRTFKSHKVHRKNLGTNILGFPEIGTLDIYSLKYKPTMYSFI